MEPGQEVVADQAPHDLAQPTVGVEVEGRQFAPEVAPVGSPPRPGQAARGRVARPQQEDLAPVRQPDTRWPAVEDVDQPHHPHHRRGLDVAAPDSL